MKNFLIGGTIINDSAEAWAYEDVTPSQVRAFLAKLEPGDDVTFEISSPGGSVTGGIAIANLIREASKNGHATKAHVIGVAASMASVIACSCDEIDIDESAFFMIHNPWTVAQGDAEELRKQADVLDQMKAAILSFYRSKFDKTDDELNALMDDETWFTGASAADFAFKANVIATEEPLKAAACARQIPGFAKVPNVAEHLFVLGKCVKAEAVTASDGSEPSDEFAAPPAAPVEQTAAPVEQTAAVAEPTAAVEDPFTARLAAAMKSRDTEINQLKAQIKDLEGRAVKLAADMERDYEAKIADFKSQLDAKDMELIAAKAEVTSLAKAAEKAKGELRQCASALRLKETALATLNANVNTPPATQKWADAYRAAKRNY